MTTNQSRLLKIFTVCWLLLQVLTPSILLVSATTIDEYAEIEENSRFQEQLEKEQAFLREKTTSDDKKMSENILESTIEPEESYGDIAVESIDNEKEMSYEEPNFQSPEENDVERNLQAFDRWGLFENNNLYSGNEFLPASFMQVASNANTRYILNGTEIQRTTSIPSNSELRIEDLGGGEDRIDAIWNFGNVPSSSNFRVQYNGTSNSVSLLTSIESTRQVIPVSVRHIYANGEQVSDRILLNYGIGRSNHFSIETIDAIYSSQFDAAAWTISQTNNSYLFNREYLTSYSSPINIITSPEVNMEVGSFRTVPSATGTTVLQLYSQAGPSVENNSPSPTIEGNKIADRFVSSYTIKQEVGSITNGEYTMIIKKTKSFHQNLEVISIVDQDGSNIIANTVIVEENESLKITLPSEEIMKFRGKSLVFSIEAEINKNYNGLLNYLKEDSLLLPLNVSTNYHIEEKTGVAETWARPWGEGIHQEISLNTSTNELNPADLVGNLENKLLGDEPFVVDFAEEREFDTLGETSIGVVIESKISGIQNTVTVPLTVIEKTSCVFVHHIDSEGDTLAESEEIIGKIGDIYETSAKEIENYRLTKQPENATGIFEDEPIEVIYIYETAPVMPVDPLDPDKDINPENPPVLPENQGLLSLDFASSFDFGTQVISAKDQTYYAKPQRLLDEEGNILEGDVRPNYVQLSDRRPTQERDGWELSVRQNEQFTGSDGELTGARLVLQNQQIATAQDGTEPGLQHTNPMALIPGGAKRTLLKAQGPEGEGTWIYRFGNAETAAQSVALEVPKGAAPSADRYKTTLTWELSSVPKN